MKDGTIKIINMQKISLKAKTNANKKPDYNIYLSHLS